MSAEPPANREPTEPESQAAVVEPPPTRAHASQRPEETFGEIGRGKRWPLSRRWTVVVALCLAIAGLAALAAIGGGGEKSSANATAEDSPADATATAAPTPKVKPKPKGYGSLLIGFATTRSAWQNSYGGLRETISQWRSQGDSLYSAYHPVGVDPYAASK